MVMAEQGGASNGIEEEEDGDIEVLGWRKKATWTGDRRQLWIRLTMATD